MSATGRGSRYSSLTQQVSQAVSEASGTGLNKAQAAQPAQTDTQAHSTGMNEVRCLENLTWNRAMACFPELCRTVAVLALALAHLHQMQLRQTPSPGTSAAC